jgi:hypothetical protein
MIPMFELSGNVKLGGHYSGQTFANDSVSLEDGVVLRRWSITFAVVTAAGEMGS